MTGGEYTCLCEEFLSAAEQYVDNNCLVTLKQYYAECIDSRRRLSTITDLKTLLRLLEKRDALSSNNLEPLYYITAQYMKKSNFEIKIKAYESWIQAKYFPYSGIMYINRNEDETSDRMRESYVSSRATSNASVCTSASSKTTFSCDPAKEPLHEQHGASLLYTHRISKHEDYMLQQKVLLYISEQLGRSWRDVVRYLRIPEAKIDELELKHPFDVKEQCYQSLKFCINTCCDSSTWKIQLMEALDAGRRKDLREWVAKETCRN